MLAQRLAHGILVKMEIAGDSPDDRVQDAVARSREVKRYVDQVWPAVDPARLVLRLLGDADFLAAVADGVLDRRRAGAAAAGTSRSGRPGRRAWSLADAVLIDEAADLVERDPVAGARGRRRGAGPLPDDAARGRTALLDGLDDGARRPRPGHHAVGHPVVGGRAGVTSASPDAHVEQLTKGFRVPGEVIEYAARLLPMIAPGLEPPTSVRRTRGELGRRTKGSLAELPRIVDGVLGRVGSVGLIMPDALLAPVVDALTSAGIGHAVLGAESPTRTSSRSGWTSYPPRWRRGWSSTTSCWWSRPAIVAGEADRVTGLRRLYVCLTRAVTSLAVLHVDPLPEELGSP